MKYINGLILSYIVLMIIILLMMIISMPAMSQELPAYTLSCTNQQEQTDLLIYCPINPDTGLLETCECPDGYSEVNNPTPLNLPPMVPPNSASPG